MVKKGDSVLSQVLFNQCRCSTSGNILGGGGGIHISVQPFKYFDVYSPNPRTYNLLYLLFTTGYMLLTYYTSYDIKVCMHQCILYLEYIQPQEAI